MADYRLAIPIVRKYEGGYVNHPNDKGGPTNIGITLSTWKSYCKRKGRSGDIESLKRMSDDEWNEIFKTYWNRFKADDIDNQVIANFCVDWLWNSGGVAIRHVQRIVGVDDDGIVGGKTLAAINGYSPITLLGKLRMDRIKFVESIVRRDPSQKVHLKGWKNRINSFHF